jgi:hypothetical protein
MVVVTLYFSSNCARKRKHTCMRQTSSRTSPSPPPLPPNPPPPLPPAINQSINQSIIVKLAQTHSTIPHLTAYTHNCYTHAARPPSDTVAMLSNAHTGVRRHGAGLGFRVSGFGFRGFVQGLGSRTSLALTIAALAFSMPALRDDTGALLGPTPAAPPWPAPAATSLPAASLLVPAALKFPCAATSCLDADAKGSAGAGAAAAPVPPKSEPTPSGTSGSACTNCDVRSCSARRVY